MTAAAAAAAAVSEDAPRIVLQPQTPGGGPAGAGVGENKRNGLRVRASRKTGFLGRGRGVIGSVAGRATRCSAPRRVYSSGDGSRSPNPTITPRILHLIVPPSETRQRVRLCVCVSILFPIEPAKQTRTDAHFVSNVYLSTNWRSESRIRPIYSFAHFTRALLHCLHSFTRPCFLSFFDAGPQPGRNGGRGTVWRWTNRMIRTSRLPSDTNGANVPDDESAGPVF